MWISAPKLFKVEQLFVAEDKRDLEMGVLARLGSWSGFLEALPILCLSSLWFQWSLFVKGIKERKNTEKEMGSERKWRKERKKNVVKLKEKKHYHRRPTLSSLTLSSVVVIAVYQLKGRQNFWNKVLPVVFMWIHGKKGATPHKLFFFFFP